MKNKRHQPVDRKVAMETIRTLLPATAAKFVEVQLDLNAKTSKGRRYSEDTKAFALSLYHVSGKAYRLLSKLFCLPSKRSLLRWVSVLPDKPGLTDEAMKVIEQKVKTMNESSKQCIITLDEMSIKSNLQYDPSKDQVIGVEDDGVTKGKLLANSALVFMLRGITETWKQPVAYYLVNESSNSAMVKEKLFQILKKMESIGLKVVAVVSDLGSNFQKFIRDLGVTPTRPWFVHNGAKIFYLYDPPHIIKAIRNNLINYNFHFSGKVASWSDITTVYNHDKTLPIRLCPKLTDRHMQPNGFQKMRVKYATQTLSHTVSAAVETYMSLGRLPSSACGTAELVSKLDQTFDCLNSSTFNSPKGLRRPITHNSPHEKFFQEMLTFIPNIKVINKDTTKDVTSTLKCLKALRVTINATLQLWNQLKESGLKFLCTRRLNQDCLENFFGQIRQQGGNSDNPTAFQFGSAFRKLFFRTLLQHSTGNCAEDLDHILIPLKSSSKKKTPTEPITDDRSKVFEESDYRELIVNTDETGENAVTYVARYLASKALKKHKSSTCENHLVN
jgi:hypothetical protein